MKDLRKVSVFVMAAMITFCFAMTGWSADAGKIDINKASVDELTQLKQIGKKTAEAIVAYRKANGPFKTIEDLMNVKGIGAKKFEMNKDRITVAAVQAKPAKKDASKKDAAKKETSKKQ